ncbi:P-loop containing nucleoside triphosphate hydrolase protein [Parathielavia appendiculata]|uniref:P-loop containing nucleoside triphosphate hydrolase protein n=1 Tax=Parathielavia appendiculata TaxID=2587402 RepID=A0AAN6TP73_9PEZI|nr:P-loop containing nucleoside triphosphate hydrolase protein [Parathielavia appendiculata]
MVRGSRGGRGNSRGSWHGPAANRGRSQRSDRDDQTHRPRRVCAYFLAGRCTYGSSCRFSHDEQDVARAREEESSSGATPGEAQRSRDDYFDFKRQIRRYEGSSISLSRWSEIASVWTLATSILDAGNRELHQSVARDLADEEIGGPSFVGMTVRLCNMAQQQHCFEIARPFLRTITHPSLLRCLSIDSFVGTIFRVFGCSNGNQGVAFFSGLHSRLNFSQDTQEALSLIISALYELLHRERKCLLNDDMPNLLATLELKTEQLRVEMGDESRATSELENVAARLGILRRMMDGARGRLANGAPAEAVCSPGDRNFVHSTFPMQIVVPGGAHDNDFADITKIQIFPTLGEVTSDVSEYLPTIDFSQPHFLHDPVQRHLDSAFRLLRHDIFGPLKEAVGALLAQPNLAHAGLSSRFITGNIRAHAYSQASVQHLLIDGCLEAILAFATPPQLRKRSLADQRRWWEESSRLEPGGLVCFVSSRGDDKSLMLFVVTKKNTKDVPEGQHRSTLVSDDCKPAITVRLASEAQSSVAMLTRMYVEKQEGLLIELPGLLPETFVPILGNLQRMMRDGELAFRRYILPHDDSQSGGAQGAASMSPPTYARRPGFKFRLQSITRSGQPALELDPTEPVGSLSPEVLENATGLDRGQSNALIAALTGEYALIQGPPGTGKSYVGVQLVRVLLDHKDEANLGPILVICYTNHALDQFLKHLLDVGIDKIIRIGGQSRAEELEGKNLRIVSKGMAKTPVESRILGQNYSEQKTCLEDAGHRLAPLHQVRKGRLTWSSLRHFLVRHRPEIARQFQAESEDNFQLVGSDPVQVWLGCRQHQSGAVEHAGGETETLALTARAERNIYSLTQHERWALANSWKTQLTQIQSDHLFELVEQVKQHKERIHSVHDDMNRRTLLQADVVGVTTTGLARNIKMLHRLGVKVVICEEAAEVMEPHLISALMPGVEHFIQIGDHRQLRPQIQNYLQFSLETAAGRAHQLDRSQFERRAVGEPGLAPLPVAQLNVQRRMRPEISQLIRRVYPNLVDHDCVRNLPSVVGMRDNLFWLDHDHPEDAKDDGARVKSHSNPWEVSLAAALVRHLVRQGEYSSTDIALLTPYTGQLQKLRAALSKDFEVFLSDRDLETLAKESFETNSSHEESPATDSPPAKKQKVIEKKTLLKTIRLATVDNFQGEEAKVIVVSLVRSNNISKIGFLRIENRINVLLSRAQHGMYLIGNAKTYRNVPMWADVLQQLNARQAVGSSIALACPRHPDTPIMCSTPEDFVLRSPEGGCTLTCDRRLDPCGHKCPAPCHSKRLHDAFDCLQPCPRLREMCSHPCPKLCGQVCGPCVVRVDGVKLPCGHVKNGVACYQTLDSKAIRCSQPVEKVVPWCGHTVTVPCFREVAPNVFTCPMECGQLLPCRHPCPGTCGRCRSEGEGAKVMISHQRCDKVCERPYGTCNHRCAKACHDGQPCGICQEKCEVQCPHSRCNQECQKPCAPCIEKCTWSCAHQGSCMSPCAAPCNRLPCNERCTNTLRCGHQCPSFCGEDCPHEFCQLCCSQKDAQVDLMEFKTYSEISLDETPVVVLSCGHSFTGETLDGLVGMNGVYTTDKYGHFNGLQELSGELTAVPTCPYCKIPIRQFSTKRYNRLINKAVLDETSKRFLVNGRDRLAELEKRVVEEEEELDASRFAVSVGLNTKSDRYAAATRLDKETARLRREMNVEHQPTKKLFDAVLTFQRLERENAGLEHALRNISLSDSNSSPFRLQAPGLQSISQPVYDQQIALGAHRLQLRIQEAMLRDTFTILSRRTNSSLTLPLAPANPLIERSARFLQFCKELIGAATKAKLPRLVIPTCLAYARITQLSGWYRRAITTAAAMEGAEPNIPPVAQGTDNAQDGKEDTTETARALLAQALELCDSFPVGKDYKGEVEETMRMFEGPRYEAVTPEEIAAIKSAMVSGPRGLATHVGHWYTCRNGHPFAIGECGMPMEQARCPECGEAIGGTNHMAMDGTQRDMRMESE